MILDTHLIVKKLTKVGKNAKIYFVKDHCEALFKIFKKGKIGEFYNIGSNKNLSNLEVCKNILDISKVKEGLYQLKITTKDNLEINRKIVKN